MHLYLYPFDMYSSLTQYFVMAGVTSNMTSMVSVKGIAVEVLVYYIISLIKLSVIVGYKVLVYGVIFENIMKTKKRL